MSNIITIIASVLSLITAVVSMKSIAIKGFDVNRYFNKKDKNDYRKWAIVSLIIAIAIFNAIKEISISTKILASGYVIITSAFFLALLLPILVRQRVIKINEKKIKLTSKKLLLFLMILLTVSTCFGLMYSIIIKESISITSLDTSFLIYILFIILHLCNTYSAYNISNIYSSSRIVYKVILRNGEGIKCDLIKSMKDTFYLGNENSNSFQTFENVRIIYKNDVREIICLRSNFR